MFIKSVINSPVSSSHLMEKTRILFQGIPLSIVVSILNALLISYLLKDLIEHRSIAIWLALIVVFNIFRLILLIQYRRAAISRENAGTWHYLFIMCAASSGILWGSAVIFLFPQSDLLHQVLLAFVIGGMSAGAVTTLAISKIATFSFILPALLPLPIHFFILEGEIYISMGLMTSLFVIVLVSSTLRLSKTIEDNVRLMLRTESREYELLQSKRFLEQSNKLANVGGFEIDMFNKSIYWAKQTYAIHGLKTYIDLNWEKICAFYDDEDAKKFSLAFKKCETNKLDFDIELSLNTAVNEKKWVRIIGQPVLKENRVVSIVGAYQDISANKNIEKLKNEFISTVSHELRTPLTSIRGALGLLRHGLKDKASEEQNKLLTISNNNTERLLFLINDILDVEKIASGKLDIYLLKERVKQLLEYSIEINQSFADQFDVEFVLANDIPDLTIEVDAGRFVQIMANLLSNAAKFSDKGSKVDIGVHAEDGQAVITVTDYGKGIPTTFNDKIFQKFSQADGSSTRHYSGTGLGLSICKSLAEKMDGKIDFTSKEGQGTCFSIKFELIDAEENAA